MSRAVDPPTASATEPPRLELSASQLAGGALASVTSALAASRFGVSGTVVGAAFGSLVSGIAAAVYATSLKTAHYKIKTTKSLVLRAPVPFDGEPTVAVDPTDPTSMPAELSGRAVQLPGATMSVPGPPPADAGPFPASGGQPVRRSRRERGRRPIWQPVAMFAGIAFVSSMVTIAAVETAIGHPVSDAKGSGTSVGVIVGGGAERSHPAATPSPTATTTGDPASTSGSPSPSDPSASPSPTDSPTTGAATPTTDLPAPGATTATGGPSATAATGGSPSPGAATP